MAVVRLSTRDRGAACHGLPNSVETSGAHSLGGSVTSTDDFPHKKVPLLETAFRVPRLRTGFEIMGVGR